MKCHTKNVRPLNQFSGTSVRISSSSIEAAQQAREFAMHADSLSADTQTSPDSARMTGNHTLMAETDLDESGQIWTNLNTCEANSQPTARIPHNASDFSSRRGQVRAAALYCRP